MGKTYYMVVGLDTKITYAEFDSYDMARAYQAGYVRAKDNLRELWLADDITYKHYNKVESVYIDIAYINEEVSE